jgi:glutamate carboxypeptidase
MKEHEAAMLRDLEAIVNIDSASGDKPGVDAVSGWLRERLAAMGWVVEVLPQETVGDTVIARKQGGVPGTIGVFVHVDTVHPQGTTESWRFEINGDRATGPGVIDMKGGLITGLYAFGAINWDKCKSVVLAINGEEEIGSKFSSEHLRLVTRQSECVLSLEPARPNGALVPTRRGAASFNLTVRGKAAHALNEPENGRSAIAELAHKVVALEALTDPERELSVSVGIIQGGGGSGTAVPEEAGANFWISFRRQEDYEQCLQQVKALCAQPAVPDTICMLNGGIVFPALEPQPGSTELADAIAEVADSMNIDAPHATGGAGDLGFASAEGKPAMCGLGPVGGRLHTPNEYLIVSSLAPRAAFFANILYRLSAGPSG